MNRLAPIAFALILSACGTPEGRATAGSETAEPAYTISPEGAGGLKAATPFTVPAMERAFPRLEVVTVSDPDTPAFHVREPGSLAPLYVVTPDWTRGYAGAVATSDPGVEGAGGLRVGVTRYSGLPQGWQGLCVEEAGPSGNGYTCEQQAEGAGFRLEFVPDEDDPLLSRMIFLPPVP